MSKLGGVDWMLLLHEKGTGTSSKNIITESAIAHQMRSHIPPARCFSTRRRETAASSPLDIRPFQYGVQFNLAQPGCLSPVTINDKLLIVAHGEEDKVGPAGASVLALYLRGLGLNSVGLVTFKACNVGLGHYLDDFVAAAGRIGLRIGWAKGYCGWASTVLGDDGDARKSRPDGKFATEYIDFEYNGQNYQRTGNARYKIVRGPLNPFTEPVGRYR